MKDSTPQEILYGLENFGIPVRDGYLEDARSYIELGLLTQEQVDEACRIGQKRIEEENIRKYGTTNPTLKQMIRHALESIERTAKILRETPQPKNFVGFNDGKYSFGEEIYTTSLAGCTGVLLYLEKGQRREGILTHYAPLHLSQNISKLEELALNLKFKPDYQRGVLLVQSDGNEPGIRSTKYGINKRGDLNLLKTSIGLLFHGIALEDTLVYGSRGIKAARLNPAGKYWESKEFGRREF